MAQALKLLKTIRLTDGYLNYLDSLAAAKRISRGEYLERLISRLDTETVVKGLEARAKGTAPDPGGAVRKTSALIDDRYNTKLDQLAAQVRLSAPEALMLALDAIRADSAATPDQSPA